MNEITIAGNTYRYGKLNAFQQFHIERRIMPLVFSAFPAFFSTKDEKEKDSVVTFQEILEKSRPMADVLSKMSDEDADYVTKTCLSIVQRKQGMEWVSLMSDGRLMFDDLDAFEMMLLSFFVIRRNLANFMQKLVTFLADPVK